MTEGLAGMVDTMMGFSNAAPSPQAFVDMTFTDCWPRLVHSMVTFGDPWPVLTIPPLVSQTYWVPGKESTMYSSMVFRHTAPSPCTAVTCSGSVETITSKAAGIPFPQLFCPLTMMAFLPGVSQRMTALDVP